MSPRASTRCLSQRGADPHLQSRRGQVPASRQPLPTVACPPFIASPGGGHARASIGNRCLPPRALWLLHLLSMPSPMRIYIPASIGTTSCRRAPPAYLLRNGHTLCFHRQSLPSAVRLLLVVHSPSLPETYPILPSRKGPFSRLP